MSAPFSNEVLFTRVKRLVATERRIGLEILECLWQIEQRKAYGELRYDGLFTYCVRELGFTDAQAWQRIQAMRALHEMPELGAKIESGELSVSTVAKAQNHFRKERKAGRPVSREEKLELFSVLGKKSCREVDATLAEVRGEVIVETLVVELDAELKGLWREVRDLAAHRSGGYDAEVLKILAKEWLEKNDPIRVCARMEEQKKRRQAKKTEAKKTEAKKAEAKKTEAKKTASPVEPEIRTPPADEGELQRDEALTFKVAESQFEFRKSVFTSRINPLEKEQSEFVSPHESS